MTDFNPNSTDALFARVLQRLDTQDKVLEEIRDGVKKTNGRVTALEREKWHQRGFTAAIAAAIAGAFEYLKSR